MNIANAVVAITGGAQGLGLAMACRLVARGARVALLDVNADKLSEALTHCAAAAQEHGYSTDCCAAYPCNVADEQQVENAFAAIVRDFGQLDALVNNAGVLRDGLLLKVRDGEVTERLSLSQWQTVIDVNLTAPFLCTRAAATQMVGQKRGGCIVNICSISMAGNMGQSNYSAAKAGLASMTVVWAKELARYNVRVCGIAPGFIATDMTAHMKPEALEKMTRQIPLQRMGEADDIAHTLQYLLENEYISGRIVEVDGGLRL
ncbi:SDR family oxidoreductase [Thalassolituus sp. C2-1]|uniref:SDR family oxidoreductase n=1 Tax=Venatorbacter sp. C2-1 TaxID=2597518 RepID=UPI001193E8BE|nr:SDR family oxidoreductase [Thalassolituus sp. C2-1]TVV44937.1 SDR family oxidoreductase [Thalassolituus sp. C2-1]